MGIRKYNYKVYYTIGDTKIEHITCTEYLVADNEYAKLKSLLEIMKQVILDEISILLMRKNKYNSETIKFSYI